jgi:aspartate 1-decarboxylase
MFRKMLKSKIHRATITGADLNYEGSISIDPRLIAAAGLTEYEAVNIWNITNGQRFETYVIRGREDSGDICINGAAARLVSPGDKIIIASFSYYLEEELRKFMPKVIFVDEDNNIAEIRAEIPGPQIF